MIATDNRTHNTNLMDASFSYLNNQKHFTIKLPKKNNLQDEDEIGIFGAEKYFTGAIDDHHLLTTSNNNHHHPAAHYPSSNNNPQPPPCPSPKPKTRSTTPSVRSESSWNSRKGLLATNGTANDHRKKITVKSLLASLGCNCNDKDSVDITENKVHVKEPAKQPIKPAAKQPVKSLSSRWADEDVHGKNEMNIKREDCFTFPVLNSSMPDGKHPELPQAEREKKIRTRENTSEVFGSPILEKGKKSFSLERKLTMLNWDGVTPRAEVMDVSRNGGHNDTASDASSDLFEIESFSTNENNSFLAKQASENNDGRPSNANGYAPSEASVDWSVITASVADFSTVEDSTVIQRVKAGADTERVKGSGILSGCKNLKAVRVSGDEHCMTAGGEKAAVMVAPTMREWCRRLESVAPITTIQADTKLVGAGSDAHRGQNGFGTARSIPRMHSTHASHHLYIQQ